MKCVVSVRRGKGGTKPIKYLMGHILGCKVNTKAIFFFFSFLKEAQQRRTGTILIQETNIALRSRVQLHMCLKLFIRQSYRLRREKATLTLLSLSSTLPLPAAFSLVTWPLSWLPTRLASVPFPAPDLENLHLLVIQSSCDSETCTL